MADIGDGSTIAIAGFGIGHRFPSSLLLALREKGTRHLCVVCNSMGASEGAKAEILAENDQVSRLIASFSARPGGRTASELQIAAGKIDLELVPQGTLVERLRAAGAGIAAFYTPTGADTELARGKELRYFGGRPHVLEHALPVDFAFVRAYRGDRLGNLEFRGASENFNPSFAKAARVAIAEVDEIVEPGQIPPESVGLPGIFISRIVKATVTVDPASLVGQRKRGADTRRDYNGKPGLTRSGIAERASLLLPEGGYVNLGSGIPTLVSDFVADRDVVLHAENGVLGYGPLADGQTIDPDYFNAGGGFVSPRPGIAVFDSVTSFEMARSGRLDAVVLGAYQVDECGSLANWSTPNMTGGGVGGAMDLVASDSALIIVMEHRDSQGRPKLVKRCTYPVTAENRVDFVVTDLALLRRVDGAFQLVEVASGFDADEVIALTDMHVEKVDCIGIMQDAIKGAATSVNVRRGRNVPR